MNTTPIALFSTRADAEPVRLRLAQAGIAAEIHEELWLQKLWFVSKNGAGVRLEVASEEFERAEQLLIDWDQPTGALRQAVHCPQCKSLLVDFPQYARNSVMTNIAAGLLAEVGLLEKDYYCEHCHYTWPKDEAAAGKKRQHMAPYYFIEGVGEKSASKPVSPAQV